MAGSCAGLSMSLLSRAVLSSQDIPLDPCSPHTAGSWENNFWATLSTQHPTVAPVPRQDRAPLCAGERRGDEKPWRDVPGLEGAQHWGWGRLGHKGPSCLHTCGADRGNDTADRGTALADGDTVLWVRDAVTGDVPGLDCTGDGGCCGHGLGTPWGADGEVGQLLLLLCPYNAQAQAVLWCLLGCILARLFSTTAVDIGGLCEEGLEPELG